uniref:CCHC-type domain-containing protein n=1 Tax=Setaria italica TaxID=4555 RepID=K3Y274_SETIT
VQYPTWASDIEINFASRGIVEAIQEPSDGAPPVTDKNNFSALFSLRIYIHKDLKQEYLMERCPLALWKALKERYEQQEELIWPLANHDICSKLKFCEKELTDAEKIEKTLSTMLPEDRIWHQQYRSSNFQQYSQLIHTLSQVEKHHELLLQNAHQRPLGCAPLPEVHYNVHNNAGNKKEFKGNNFSRNSAGKHKFNNRRKFHKRGKGKEKAPPPRGNSRKLCNRCGSNNHVAKECRCPPHLVLLYQKSLKKPKFDKPRYEVHFNLTEPTPKVESSQLAPTAPQNNLTLPQENPIATTGMLNLPEEDPMDGMLIEYFSKDPLEDLE